MRPVQWEYNIGLVVLFPMSSATGAGEVGGKGNMEIWGRQAPEKEISITTCRAQSYCGSEGYSL